MNSKTVAVYLLLACIILLNTLLPHAYAETGTIEIIDVYWGEPGKEWAAMPGDRANLVIDFRSLIEDETICGLKAILWPIDPFRPFPFKGVKPGNLTTYTDQQIRFGDKAQLIFSDVIIDNNAKPGKYEAYLYFFYYDCKNPKYPLIMALEKIDIYVWPLPEFRIINISWLDSEGLQTSAGPGDINKILSITFTVPKYYEASNIASTLYLNEHFTNLTGGDLVKISYAGKASEGQYFTLKFPLNIKSDTSLGTYNLKLVLNYYDRWLSIQNQEISIPVTIAGSSDLDISIQPPPPVFTTGSISNIGIKIMNNGSSPVYSVKVSLSSNDLIVLNNEVRIIKVGPHEELSFSFPIRTPGALSEGFYPLTIKAEYFDSNGVTQTVSKTIKVEVRSPPAVSLSSYIKNPEVIVGKNHDLSIIIENLYDSPIRDIIIKTSFENLPIALVNSSMFYFQQIPAKSFIELKIPVRISPLASTGISYGRLSITYRNPSGELKTDEVTVPIIIKPDLKFEFSGVVLSPTPVAAGESLDISGDVYNRGLSTGKLCEVRVRASPPLIETTDSVYYIGDISGLSKASFSVSVDVAKNARPGKYAANLTISCSDVFGDTTEYSKTLEIEITSRTITPTATRSFATGTAQHQTTIQGGWRLYMSLQNQILISIMVAALIGVSVMILLRRCKKREAP
ncbi:MAG: hypothetical protein QXL22_05145 [Candidatus Nezhaarchaeales archaeon]